jgi:hypothetical protein
MIIAAIGFRVSGKSAGCAIVSPKPEPARWAYNTAAFEEEIIGEKDFRLV